MSAPNFDSYKSGSNVKTVTHVMTVPRGDRKKSFMQEVKKGDRKKRFMQDINRGAYV